VSVAAFISSQRTDHDVPHTLSCRALGLSESWFYKWRGRRPTGRQQRRVELADAIRIIFDNSGGTYGSPRVTLDLHAAGWQVSENTVAKLMAELGLAGRTPKRRRSLTRQGKRKAAPDRVRRQFTAVAPNLLWCGDLTEVDTGEGKLYLATVLDLFSRRLLGYAMSEHHDADVAVASLRMAAATRGGTVDGVIFHSDRGSEYTAEAYANACRRLGVHQSMGRVGCALDKDVASYCTSLQGLGRFAVAEWAALSGDQAWVAWGGRFEESFVLVGGLVRDEQTGFVPVLDRGGVHCEVAGEFGDG
jgi:putative transposase